MTDMSALEIFVVVASPFVGSFLGVVIERLPAGGSVVAGRSRCNGCGRILAPLELMPVLSWLLLRGRCRHCGMRLGMFYPAVELAALLIAVWSVVEVPAWLLLPTVFLGWSLLALSAIDWQHLLLPDALTMPLIAVGLLVGAIAHRDVPLDGIIGAVAGGTLFAAISWFYQRVRKRDGLGYGDAKLFAAAGAWLGWQGLASVLLIGAATGLAGTLVIFAIRGVRGTTALHTEVPFGPYLALAIWLTWLYGPLQVA